MHKQIQQVCFAVNDIKALLRSPVSDLIILLEESQTCKDLRMPKHDPTTLA